MAHLNTLSFPDFMQHQWKRIMDSGIPGQLRLNNFLTELWLEGEITLEVAELWSEKISFCPEGRNHHADYGRTWCSYCGDIDTHWCGGCGLRFARDIYPEDFLRIKETFDGNEGYCCSCSSTRLKYNSRPADPRDQILLEAAIAFECHFKGNTHGLVCMCCHNETAWYWIKGFNLCRSCAERDAAEQLDGFYH